MAVMLHSAEQKRVPHHLSIRGITLDPQHFYVDYKDRKALKVACAVMLGAPTSSYVQQLTGTEYEGCPDIDVYKKATEQDVDYTALSAPEYRNFLQRALKHFNRQVPGLRRNPKLRIIHDRAKPHTSKLVTQWAQQEGYKVHVLPPRSPDMDPLDYGIFGPFKTWLQMGAAVGGWTWSNKCRKAVAYLEKVDVAPTVKEFPQRLQACIEAEGHHLANALIRVKKSRVA